MYVYTHIYTYIHIYTHIYTYIHIYTYTHTYILTYYTYMTKHEQKKLRRTTRHEREQEKRDKMMMGLIPAPEPKFKLSNFMQVQSALCNMYHNNRHNYTSHTH
jgi:hypothetical protein